MLLLLPALWIPYTLKILPGKKFSILVNYWCLALQNFTAQFLTSFSTVGKGVRNKNR